MNAQVGESSACATALLCGVKANYETVGLDSSARFEDCYTSTDAHVPSLIKWAQDQGEDRSIGGDILRDLCLSGAERVFRNVSPNYCCAFVLVHTSCS
jgi:hypothetical protein